MRKIILKKEPCLIAKQKAFPYQEEAFNAVKDLPYSAIFHEQGLGKTKIAIDLTLYWLEKKDIDTVLIVTKKQLVQNWVNEFKFHTHVKPAVLNNNKQNNFYIFNGASRIVITNFETNRSSNCNRYTKIFKSCIIYIEEWNSKFYLNNLS